jgi:hypothetical protein
MRRSTTSSKAVSFHFWGKFRPQDRTAAQVLRGFMRLHLARRVRRAFAAAARRQSLAAAAAADDPRSDEAAVMRELKALISTQQSGWR